LVVPRSIPITFAITNLSFWQTVRAQGGTRLCSARRDVGPHYSAGPLTHPAGFRGYIGGNPMDGKEKRGR
jgi:hypothetical protein